MVAVKSLARILDRAVLQLLAAAAYQHATRRPKAKRNVSGETSTRCDEGGGRGNDSKSHFGDSVSSSDRVSDSTDSSFLRQVPYKSWRIVSVRSATI